MSVAPIEQRVPGAWADRLPAAAPAAKRPLRLLMVTPRFFPLTGGVETHVFEVARRLVAAGVEVTVLTSNPGGKWPQREAYDGVPVERVPAWPADRDYYYAPDLFNVIGRGDWDLMHLQCYHTLVAPLAMLAARRAGLPYVVTFHPGGHSSPVRNRLRGVQQLLLRPLLAHAARLITVARFELEHFHSLLRLPRERFTYIPNGCDVGGLEAGRGADRKQVVRVPIHPTAGADEDVCAPRTGGADGDVCAPGTGGADGDVCAPRTGGADGDVCAPRTGGADGDVCAPGEVLIASVGRLERYKGHHRILAALPRILQQVPEARLWIAGAGPEEAALRAQAEQLGVAERVEIRAFPGDQRAAMLSRLAGASLAVLLSDYETHPIAAIEAIALGRSVLVADTSGLAELAQQGLARAIPTASSPEQVAAAAVELLQHPLHPPPLDLPTWDDCTAQLLDLYGDVVGQAEVAAGQRVGALSRP